MPLSNSSTAVVMSARVDVTTDTFYFGLRVPSGRQFILHDRALTLTEGSFDIDVVDADGFTGGTEGAKITLDDSVEGTVETSLFYGVTPQNEGTVLEFGSADTGTGGPGQVRAIGASGTDSVEKWYSKDVLLRVNRETGGSDYKATLRIIGWERDL